MCDIRILLLYDDDIVLMEKHPYDLGKKLITLEELCSSMGMTMNTDKTKVMIIKSKRITYDTFVFENNSLEEVLVVDPDYLPDSEAFVFSCVYIP